LKSFFECSENFAEAVKWRRLLHQHPQPGWLEFYATGFIAEKLSDWGYKVLQGSQIIDAEKRMFVPDCDIMRKAYEKTLATGIKEQYIKTAKGGLTGVVGILRGKEAGPQVAFRFDIDALEIIESQAASHRPNAEGYVSQYSGYAHMCGHDAHVAIGLLLAKYFADNIDQIKGTIKLIFQPDEEKLSGAKAMLAKGVVDDVEYLIGGHVGANLLKVGQIGLVVKNILAVTRSEVIFKGKAIHSTGRPDLGKNALLGVCAAVTNLHAIARHGLGVAMLNVGKIEGGIAWNVVPDQVRFWLETRGVTSEINDYMQEKAREVINGAAKMYGLDFEIKTVTDSPGGSNSVELIDIGTRVAHEIPQITEVVPEVAINASEDFVILANAVQNRGGKAIYLVHGTPVGEGQHSNAFDIDEKVILNAAQFYACLYKTIVNRVNI
jgi:aminobenzoyl-glutamate utilization protein A